MAPFFLSHHSPSYSPWVQQPLRVAPFKINSSKTTSITSNTFKGKAKDKKGFREEQEKLVADLKQAGITRDVLKEKWNVVLWFVRDQGDKIRLLVETPSKAFNMDRFEQWLQQALKPFRGEGTFEVKVKSHSLNKCCDKQCDGCLAGSKEHRKEWVK